MCDVSPPPYDIGANLTQNLCFTATLGSKPRTKAYVS
jgi:hypothetical protein